MSIEVKYEKGHLLIKVPYTEGEVYPISISGKSRMVATSGGFQTLEDGPAKLKYSLNVIETLPKSK